MRKILLFMSYVLVSSLLLFPVQVKALNLMESYFLKITIVENGVEHEWEYTSPGKYEYEKGEHVIKTKEAKDEMLSILKTLNLSEKAKIEDMVTQLKNEGFKKLERVDIRWMNGEHKLYTWLWEKES